MPNPGAGDDTTVSHPAISSAPTSGDNAEQAAAAFAALAAARSQKERQKIEQSLWKQLRQSLHTEVIYGFLPTQGGEQAVVSFDGFILSAILHEGARSAAVHRRRGALPRNADRVTPGRIDRQGPFNPDVVNPAVAEIAFVGKVFHSAQLQIANPHLSGVGVKEYAALSAQPVFTAADLKTVQVHIFPAKATCNTSRSCATLVSLGTSRRR